MGETQRLDIPGAATRIGSYAVVRNDTRSVFRVFIRDEKDRHLHVMDFDDVAALGAVLDMLRGGSCYYGWDANIQSHLVMTDWQTTQR